MEPYRQAEARATVVISEKFQIAMVMPEAVERADRMMINIEGDFGFKRWKDMPGFPVPTQKELMDCGLAHSWHWSVAEARFLNFFLKYSDERAKR
jgi:hypothetical protein